MMHLKFYEVDSEYIKYLKENGDEKIPNIDYSKHKKFFCGIVLTINNFNYFAPVSSYNKKAHTVFLIKDKDRKTKELKPISSLRFSFMFPCPIEYLNQKDFSKEDERVIRYLKGETIQVSSKLKGWVLICVEGYPLGFGKIDKGMIKNKYAQGWRWK